MIISEQQLVALLSVLQDSLPISGAFSLSRENRTELWLNILEQQARTLREVEE